LKDKWKKIIDIRELPRNKWFLVCHSKERWVNHAILFISQNNWYYRFGGNGGKYYYITSFPNSLQYEPTHWLEYPDFPDCEE
jgi:hypothetical protein